MSRLTLSLLCLAALAATPAVAGPRGALEDGAGRMSRQTIADAPAAQSGPVGLSSPMPSSAASVRVGARLLSAASLVGGKVQASGDELAVTSRRRLPGEGDILLVSFDFF